MNMTVHDDDNDHDDDSPSSEVGTMKQNGDRSTVGRNIYENASITNNDTNSQRRMIIINGVVLTTYKI